MNPEAFRKLTEQLEGMQAEIEDLRNHVAGLELRELERQKQAEEMQREAEETLRREGPLGLIKKFLQAKKPNGEARSF